MAIVTLVRLTLLELWRQRLGIVPIVILVLILLAGLIHGNGEVQLNGQAVAFSAREIGMGTFGLIQFCGSVLGVIAGASAIAPEIDRGTVLLLATKPVPRWGMLLGKALGTFAFLVLSCLVWGIAIAAIGGVRSGTEYIQPLLIGSWMAVLSPLLIAAMAICFSTRMPTMGALAASLFAWMLSAAAAPLVGLKNSPGYEAVGWVAQGITTILPFKDISSLASALAFGPAPSGAEWAGLLAILGWLVVAMGLFSRRNLS